MTKGAVCIVAILFLFASTGATEKAKDSLPPPLESSELIWFFGMIPEDAKVAHHYALKNTHQEPVTIVKIAVDCECVSVPKTPVIVGPGQTYLLKVVFDTKTYRGETNRDIKIVTDYKPNPEMALYFISLAAIQPRTLKITPALIAFIPGKDSQTISIENLADNETSFKLYLDHDSSLTVSETRFALDPKEKRDITISPVWNRLWVGEAYSCIVMEFVRDQTYQVTIPVKVTKY